MEIIQDNSYLSPSSESIKSTSMLNNSFNQLTDIANINFLNHPLSKEEFGLDAISQNLHLYEEKLKFLVIGDESVGKSFFIYNFFKVMNGERLRRSSQELYHTERYFFLNFSPEMKKKLVRIMNKYVSVELWDTNKKIISSSIFKSKLYL